MKRVFVLLGIIILGSIGGYLWWQNGKEPVNSTDTTQKVFSVEPGKGVREVASDLKRQGIIKDPVLFFLYVKLTGMDRHIQAGEYKLSASMSMSNVVETLQHGTFDVRVTIPEGKRAEEIAAILKKNVPTYNDNWIAVLQQNEGYLFPETYSFSKNATITQIVTRMRDTFDQNYKKLPNTDKTLLSQNEIVIIASMIEREAKLKEDRPIVASVILNRLNIGMKLDIDATLQYVIGYDTAEKTWWKKGLTEDDKQINSPYNTYANAGLPPTPISNPGFEALNAVVNHAHTDYLYYVSDKNGKNHYAKTVADHNQNVQKYLRNGE